jgi:hypothetical protein
MQNQTIYYDLKILLSCIQRRKTERNGQFYCEALARKIDQLGGMAASW